MFTLRLKSACAYPCAFTIRLCFTAMHLGGMFSSLLGQANGSPAPRAAWLLGIRASSAPTNDSVRETANEQYDAVPVTLPIRAAYQGLKS